MNNRLIQLEKLSAALNDTIRQLISGNVLENIDRDNLKRQCIELYNQILLLTPQEPQQVVKSVETKPEEIIKQETKPTLFEPQNTVTEVKEIKQAPLFEQTVPLVNDVPVPEIKEEIIPEQIVSSQPVKTETELKNTIIDSILEKQQILNKEVELSLHEKLAHTLEPKANLIEKLSATSVPSLKSAINVNLKIALVNELFNTNSVEYVKAIDKLNSSENIHEAMRYFTELKHTYNWDAESPQVKELEQLVSKRYSG
jgi:hypothetical protein